MYDLCLQGLVQRKRLWWTITITGYGPFQFYGTVEEANWEKEAKAEWEGGYGRKRPATPGERKDGVRQLRWKKANGYGLSDAELEALL